MSVLCGGMFVTKIARSFRLLIREIFNALSIDPRAWTFLKKTLISIRIIMELDEGHCYWLVIQGVREDDGDEEEKVAEEHIEAYRDMGRGAWQERQGPTDFKERFLPITPYLDVFALGGLSDVFVARLRFFSCGLAGADVGAGCADVTGVETVGLGGTLGAVDLGFLAGLVGFGASES
nr:hypothetical protein [Tanacetum cinerariifolium]